jgi:glycopeptide antibiotics resistance protein
MPPSDSFASRRWFVRVRVAVVFALVLVFLFLGWRSSPWFSELHWMPRFFARWADHHGVARNVVGFFGFGFVVFVLIGRRWLPVVAAALFATGVEVVQIWIPHRIFDLKDIYASLLGLALAWIIVATGAWILRRCLPA